MIDGLLSLCDPGGDCAITVLWSAAINLLGGMGSLEVEAIARYTADLRHALDMESGSSAANKARHAALDIDALCDSEMSPRDLGSCLFLLALILFSILRFTCAIRSYECYIVSCRCLG